MKIVKIIFIAYIFQTERDITGSLTCQPIVCEFTLNQCKVMRLTKLKSGPQLQYLSKIKIIRMSCIQGLGIQNKMSHFRIMIKNHHHIASLYLCMRRKPTKKVETNIFPRSCKQEMECIIKCSEHESQQYDKFYKCSTYNIAYPSILGQ